MLSIDQFGYISIQAVVFLKDPQTFSQSRFLQSVLAEYAERYDGDVQSVPMPAGLAPADIPRIVLVSADKQWTVRASPARVDSVWEGKEPVDDIALQLDQCWAVLKAYMKTSVVVDRLGFVIQRTFFLADAARALTQHFVVGNNRAALFDDIADFEIHARRVEQLSGTIGQVNIWNRCQTARHVETDRPVVVFVQDINTIPCPDLVFDPLAVDVFYRRAFERMAEIGRAYFPGG